MRCFYKKEIGIQSIFANDDYVDFVFNENMVGEGRNRKFGWIGEK